MGNVYHVVYNNTSSNEPSVGEMEGWIQTYDLHNNTLHPGVTNGSTILQAFERRECTYLVETGCMTVLQKNCTCTNGACTTSAELTLDDLDIALGGG